MRSRFPSILSSCVTVSHYEHTQLCFLTGINECLDDSFNSCDQICINTMASFVCGCHTGFQLNDDLMTCSGI